MTPAMPIAISRLEKIAIYASASGPGERHFAERMWSHGAVPRGKATPGSNQAAISVGSSFESWQDESGIRRETASTAVKAVVALHIAEVVARLKISKSRMTELMGTSRAQLDRLLHPDNGSATIDMLQRATSVVGKELRLSLV